MKIGSAVQPGRVPEKKRTGQDRTVKRKSHKVVIFRLYGEKPPLYRLEPKFAWWVGGTHRLRPRRIPTATRTAYYYYYYYR